ncbi:hypothetical protein P154DRAFT_527126 [Amniculicola lignicola CBS 123094]|uniref:Ferric oxidoreductase domain-containing protein n=1 Tax=Amniculicola lignicola CBS 123094 TaxID=1392246 RepID=A0A6A5VY46_9PLEO|nr:hypothetical protein P154DRAFT_527126 [Amniculicola lignicola CBS 123094]
MATAARGLIGFGISMYEPACAFACQTILQTSKLNCSTPPVADRWHGGSGLGFDTPDECFASDDAFQLSLAWCLHQHCDSPRWMIERFWATDVSATGPALEIDLTEAIQRCGGDLKKTLRPGSPLDQPSSIAKDDWKPTATSLEDFAYVEAQGSKYALLLFTTAVFVPPLLTAFSWITFALFPWLERWCLTHIVYPPLFHRRRKLLLRLIGEQDVPTRGHAIFVILFSLQNLLFCFLGHRVRWPNVNYHSELHAFIEILADRTGHLCFANLAALILYGTRCSPLIFITGWSRATYILLHRWIAYLCIGHALVHTIIYFIVHIHLLAHKFTQAYWNFGFIAIVLFLAIALFSLVPVRRSRYELFLDLHILMAFLALLACYYHIDFNFSHRWGYENWIIVCAIMWTVDRLVRGLMVLRNGKHIARCSHLDEEYLEISVEGVTGTGMAYLYFPTATTWRVWENHPFSIAASIVEKEEISGERNKGFDQEGPLFGLVDTDSDSDGDSEMQQGPSSQGTARYTPLSDSPDRKSNKGQLSIPLAALTPATSTSAMPLLPASDKEEPPAWSSGLSFLVRRQKGTTARLFNDMVTLPVLVEGPYSSHVNLLHLAATYSHIVCIAGGVGITAMLPLLRARSTTSFGRTALYFGSRTQAFVKFSGVEALQKEGSGLDVRIRVGARWQVEDIITREAGATDSHTRGVGGGDVLVVVCGPAGLNHDVRMEVVEANKKRKNGVIRLVDEHFSW